MTHRFPIKEIARQSGLGTATVDRALNGRPNVSPQTRNRVAAAIRELEAQEALLVARGRRLFVDILAEAPRRFTREICRAAEAALSEVAGAVIRPRFHFEEVMSEAEMLAALARIRKRGSQGLCLKARDTEAVRAAVDGLVEAGIPVFTLVTDLPQSRRTAYVGLDNVNAGRTAAYLLGRELPSGPSTVMTVRSQNAFLGETERHDAFRAELSRRRPDCRIVDVAGGAGLVPDTARRVSAELARTGGVAAVYSIGGGNDAILSALAAHGNAGVAFVAHDLDRDNVRLLSEGAITFVLHHDLVADMRSLFGGIMRSHGLSSPGATAFSSDVRIVGPHNIPEVRT
jgi:LacI family transcriptional regulator